MKPHLLLASKSPRRRELLGSLGLPMTVVDIDVEEQFDHAVAASEVAEKLAMLKANGYQHPLAPNEILVTADTVVVCDDVVMGKPHSRAEAVEMLRRLSGRIHQVYTGVCLCGATSSHSFTDCTHVEFRTLSDAEIDYYIDTYKPYDKAGAYGIQEWIGMVGISRIEGCYYNVMGLPVPRLYAELKPLVDGDYTLID